MAPTKRSAMDKLTRSRNFPFFEVFLEANAKLVMRLATTMITASAPKATNHEPRETFAAPGEEVELFRLEFIFLEFVKDPLK